MLTKYYDSMTATPSLFDSLWFFDDLYGSSRSRSTVERHDSSHRVTTTDEGLEMSFDLPGVKRSDLSVQVTGHQLDISGQVRGRDFKQSYRINRIYNPDPNTATLEDGVLTLRFSRTADSRPRTVDVTVK